MLLPKNMKTDPSHANYAPLYDGVLTWSSSHARLGTTEEWVDGCGVGAGWRQQMLAAFESARNPQPFPRWGDCHSMCSATQQTQSYLRSASTSMCPSAPLNVLNFFSATCDAVFVSSLDRSAGIVASRTLHRALATNLALSHRFELYRIIAMLILRVLPRIKSSDWINSS
jgi:hypothetical protein